MVPSSTPVSSNQGPSVEVSTNSRPCTSAVMMPAAVSTETFENCRSRMGPSPWSCPSKWIVASNVMAAFDASASTVPVPWDQVNGWLLVMLPLVVTLPCAMGPVMYLRNESLTFQVIVVCAGSAGSSSADAAVADSPTRLAPASKAVVVIAKTRFPRIRMDMVSFRRR